MSDESTSICLGAEHDEELFAALASVLRSLGARGSSRWGVGGSQEVLLSTVEVMGRRLTIESETYMGLTITGERGLVEQIRDLVASQVKRDK